MNIKILSKPVIVSLLCVLTGCAELNTPYSGGYRNDPYYGGGGGYRDDYGRHEDWKRDRERRELDRERDRLEDERRRLEEERRKQANQSAVWGQPAQERCPSGFTPSENKCSKEERRRGCKDMRLPGGLGCVKR